jgi:hypothetical protein
MKTVKHINIKMIKKINKNKNKNKKINKNIKKKKMFFIFFI